MRPVPSLALGTFPVSPFEMASAFGTFANEGVQIEPTAIMRIEDRKGQMLYEAKPKHDTGRSRRRSLCHDQLNGECLRTGRNSAPCRPL